MGGKSRIQERSRRESSRYRSRESCRKSIEAEAIGDFKYALRTLRRSPGYVAVAEMTLALGIAANTAIFSLLDQILLRLLPVKNPQELVLLTMRGKHYGNNWGGNAISHRRDFQKQNEVFSGMFETRRVHDAG